MEYFTTTSPVQSAVPAITLKPLLDERRTKANRRERERVKSVRNAFKDLGEIVPKDEAEPQLTRIDVVRRASEYITYLSDLLQDDSSSDSPVPTPVSATSGESTAFQVTDEEVRTSFLDYRAECDALQRLPEKRVKCNERARTRSKQTKEAFGLLKELLPIHEAEAELSRIEILKRATEYIAFMSSLLEDAGFEQELMQACDVLSSTDNTSSVAGISDLICSPETAASLSSTTSPAGSLTLDLSNIDIEAFSIPVEDSDSDYASMSPPSSAASDCSFTFPSVSFSNLAPQSHPHQPVHTHLSLARPAIRTPGHAARGRFRTCQRPRPRRTLELSFVGNAEASVTATWSMSSWRAFSKSKAVAFFPPTGPVSCKHQSPDQPPHNYSLNNSS